MFEFTAASENSYSTVQYEYYRSGWLFETKIVG